MFLRLIAAAMLLLLAPSAALAQWNVAESRNFIIYSQGSPAEIEKLGARLESYDRLMRMATGIGDEKEPVKVRIFEVSDLGKVRQAADADGGVAGFYNSNILGPYLVTPRKLAGASKDFTAELVLQHEYAHHFNRQYFPAVYPRWYTEGFAELVGSSKMMDDGRIGYGMPAEHRGNDILAYWVPLQELLTREKITYLDTYGQGWAVTHFLTFDKQRATQVRQYLLALTRGKSMAEAARVFGDLSRLNQEARRYVGSGAFEYKPVRVTIALPAIQKIRPATSGEADFMPEVAAFRDEDLSFINKSGYRERERRFRERTLQSIRAKAARHPSDAFAQYFLAEAEYAAGQNDRAEAAVNRALAVQPNHVRAMARKSILLSRRASKLAGSERLAMSAQARRLASRANKLDVEDPLPLLAYFESFRLSGQEPPPIAVEGLRQAVATYPLDMNLRQLLIDFHAAKGQYEAAISLLQAIANDPHESPRRNAARAQLAKLQAARGAQGAKAAGS
jgi:tetratricopeptide (TPR) repeat protein